MNLAPIAFFAYKRPEHTQRSLKPLKYKILRYKLMLKTSVVFMIFRRPDLTARVFETIRQAQPTKLLIVTDGARNEEEAILCQQTRAVTEQIDWDCEVLRNYSDINLQHFDFKPATNEGGRVKPRNGFYFSICSTFDRNLL